jgi:hypothetical protein
MVTMSSMFYSLQEAAGKLNKTAGELKEIVKQGKLREFRDGTYVVVKVDEVKALVSEENITISPEARPTKEPTPRAPGIEIPELQGRGPETLEALTLQDEPIDLEALGLEIPTRQTPHLETPTPAVPAAQPRIIAPDVPAAEAAWPEETAAARPWITPAPRWEAEPGIEDTVYPQRLSVKQWFLKGLRTDNAVAVMVLCLLLCAALLIFCIFGYFGYTALRAFF